MKKILLLILAVFCTGQVISQSESVKSPDGNIEVIFQIKDNYDPYPAGEKMYYSVFYKGDKIIKDSPIKLNFINAPSIHTDMKILNAKTTELNDTWERIWGKSKIVKDHCNELKIELSENNNLQRKLNLIFRAYNDGIGFRYQLPSQENINEFELASEETGFYFLSNHQVWAADYKRFRSHQEEHFLPSTLNSLLSSGLYGCPLLVNISSNCWAAITEANLTDWAGMYLVPDDDFDNALVTKLSPRIDNPEIAVKSKTPRRSPWRVILLGEEPGDLIESNLISNLNEPCEIEDTEWLQPGKSAWDRWWCGDYLPDADFEVGMNNETMKYFIDFASEMGWEYQLVDWTWYGKAFDMKNSITRPIPEIDIPDLVKYAESKNVKIIIWLNWEHTDKEIDEAFPLYEKWGVAGVKIDFMARDDQEMVNFYHRTVKKAAEHKLFVNFHGAYKPTGWSRTYPNLFTREGVLGNEYTKWSDKVTPDHCLTIPFTRMVAGPMDFTPGAFRHKMQDDFRIVGGSAPGPFVMGTRCLQLAQMIVYESPLQVLCDSPNNYRVSPGGLDFLKMVPTTWDETLVLNGKVGDYITVARRYGEDWFVGSMTDWTKRTLDIDLSFLGEGNYEAEIWKDAYDSAEYPQHLLKEKKMVSAKDKINADFSSGGGYLMVLKKTK